MSKGAHPREPKKGPGGAQDVSRGLQKVPKGAQGSLKGYPGYAKTIREVQVLYSRLYIERIVFQVWLPSFIFQVLYSKFKFYILGFIFQDLYSRCYIPGYSKFHILGFILQGFYSRCISQVAYSRFSIPSFIFQV